MSKRKNILSLALASIMLLSNTLVFAEDLLPEEILPEMETDFLDTGLSIPDRDASSWALDELVDSDRYGLYKTDELYRNNLKIELKGELKTSLLNKFEEKLEESTLEKTEKPEYLAEVKDSNSRGDFLRQVYNVLVSYEKEENLGKDPIMYLNHTGILLGNGQELFLDRAITTEEGIIFVKRAVDYIYDQNEIDSKGLMWKVEHKGNIVYLLGSIHYGETELYPFRKEVLNNFSDSEALFVEVDISNQEELMRIMMEKMGEFEEDMKKSSKFEDGTTLESQVDEEVYKKIVTIMEKHDIPEEEYLNLKVSGANQKVSEIFLDDLFSELPEEFQDEMDEELAADFEKEMEEGMAELMDNEFMQLIIEGPKLGMDFYFLDKAKTSDKKVGELESIESQMDLIFGGGLFGEMEEPSKEEELEMLKEMLESFDDEGNIVEIEEEDEDFDQEMDEELEAEMDKIFQEQADLIKGMFDAIKLGDAEKLSALFIESEGEEMLGGQLLGDRDKNMANKISDLLQGDEEKTYFVVVGAAHFVVDGTIIDNLINKGYKVEKVK